MSAAARAAVPLRATAAVLLSVLGVGCEVADGDLVADPIQTESIVQVEVLGGSFVRVGDQRMPDDEFLLRMRQRFRRAGPAAEDKPGLQVLGTEEGGARVDAFCRRVLQDLTPLGLRLFMVGSDAGE